MDPSSIHQYGSCISTPLYLENAHHHHHQHHHHQHHHHNPSLFIPSVVPSHSIPQLPAAVPRATSYSTTRRVLEETSHNSTIQTPPSTGGHPTAASPQLSGKKIHAKLEQKRRSRGARVHGTVAAPSAKTLAAAVQQNDLVPYHQYRARQRRDASMDGESVWDEELEEAFMEGRLY